MASPVVQRATAFVRYGPPQACSSQASSRCLTRIRGGERDLDHIILAAIRGLDRASIEGDPELMGELRDREMVLEICPTSNLLTKALPDAEAVRDTFRTFVENGVQFTIATDGPEVMRTHLRDEFELLTRIGALDEREAREANARGHEVAFVAGSPLRERA